MENGESLAVVCMKANAYFFSCHMRGTSPGQILSSTCFANARFRAALQRALLPLQHMASRHHSGFDLLGRAPPGYCPWVERYGN